jgi:hypothetical protein
MKAKSGDTFLYFIIVIAYACFYLCGKITLDTFFLIGIILWVWLQRRIED